MFNECCHDDRHNQLCQADYLHFWNANRPESVEKFTELGKHNIRQSVNTEQGVLGMYVMTDKADPNKFYIVEAYADETAYQAHRASPHFQAWLNGAKEMIVSRKMIETNSVVFGSKAVVVP